MEVAMVGLGRMGGNMALRLLRKGHRVITFDQSPQAVESFAAQGCVGVNALADLPKAFADKPRTVWIMVPAGDPTTQTIRALGEVLDKGDAVVDGGNTNWKLALEDAAHLETLGIDYLDAGTSGGVWGLANGYCLMVGGKPEAFDRCRPIFESLAPEDGGLVHTGPAGSGHFVKMVHNGIEYGMMQAYAEGFELMKRHPSFPGMDMHAIAEAWRTGSVVRSWLLDLVAAGLAPDPELAHVRGYVEDTGEGRWTVEAALESATPAVVVTAAVYERFRSRLEETYADKMLAMMRNQFGGHAIKTA